MGNVASYSVIEWEDTTGEAEVWEYDRDDVLLRHFIWSLPPDGEGALLVEFAPDGQVRSERQAGPSRGW